MKKGEDSKTNYVHRVREDTKRYIQELLAENERLRTILSGLEDERRELEDRVGRLAAEVESEREQTSRLQQRLGNIERENHRFSEKYVEVEQQNSNLAHLYVASYRLHSTLERPEVLSIIQEIVVNLIGSEELCVFELDSRQSELLLVSSVGIDPDCYQRIPLGTGVIGKAAQSGEVFIDENHRRNGRLPQESKLTTCIPLKIGSNVTGAIAIFSLLAQKTGLQAVDHELFDLLATHAATALRATRAQAIS